MQDARSALACYVDWLGFESGNELRFCEWTGCAAAPPSPRRPAARASHGDGPKDRPGAVPKD